MVTKLTSEGFREGGVVNENLVFAQYSRLALNRTMITKFWSHSGVEFWPRSKFWFQIQCISFLLNSDHTFLALLGEVSIPNSVRFLRSDFSSSHANGSATVNTASELGKSRWVNYMVLAGVRSDCQNQTNLGEDADQNCQIWYWPKMMGHTHRQAEQTQ